MVGVLQDLARNISSSEESAALGKTRLTTLKTVMTARFLAVFLFRLSQILGKRSILLGGVVKQVNQLLTGADLAFQCSAGPGLVLFHPVGVVVGPHVRIGSNCSLQQGCTLGAKTVRGGVGDSPVLANNVYVGAGARVLGPIQIGADSVVGANSVVITSFPANSTIVGAPGRRCD